MAMLNFREYIQNLKRNLNIKDDEYEQHLAMFLYSNNWFGINTEIINQNLYVDENKLHLYEDKIILFSKNYSLRIPEKINKLYEIADVSVSETLKQFREFSNKFDISEESQYYVLSFIIKTFPGELATFGKTDISHIMDDACNDLTKKNIEIMIKFMNWVRKHFKVNYCNAVKLEADEFKKRNVEAYDIEEYLEIIFNIFNKQLIEQDHMYEKAINSKKYIDEWLYLSLSLLSEVRNPNLKALPHPRLFYSPEETLHKIKNHLFTDEEARRTTYSVIWSLEFISFKPTKTEKNNGIADCPFFIPESLEVHIGTLFAIAEAHHILDDRTESEPLINPKNDYNSIKNAMGDRIGKLFERRNYSSQASTKTNMQNIFLYSNQILNEQSDFKIDSYILASYARSHKITDGEFSKTTMTYLKDMKASGIKASFIAKQLFERGVFSSITSMFLKVVGGEKYEELSFENQTKLMKEISLSPLEVESIVQQSNTSMQTAIEYLQQIIDTNSIEDIKTILLRLGNNRSPSKTRNINCLVASLAGCKNPNSRSCLTCECEVTSKLTIFLLAKGLNNQKIKYSACKSETEKNMHLKIIKDVYLPKIMQIISAAKELYGDKTGEILKSIFKESLEDGNANKKQEI